MNRTLIVTLFLAVLCLYVGAQNAQSWSNLNGMSPNSNCRILNIFVNIIYDVHPDTNVVESEYWPRIINSSYEGVNVPGTIPTYLLDFMDTAYHSGNLHGCITRLYGESSFDSLQLIGDFIVVNVRESRVIDSYRLFKYSNIAKAAVDVINENGFQSIYGHNSIADYDYNHDDTLFYTQVMIRNISKNYGNLAVGNGYGESIFGGKRIRINNNNYAFSSKGTLQNVGGGDISTNPTGIVPHEISHALFGSNDFHTSGGNHRQPASTDNQCMLHTMSFMNIQGGYGLMGGGNSGLVGCNGYERWRMHWKHPDASDYISAINPQNNASVNSDISREDGEKWFVLRDFVTYGDAVRIRLPYKDSIITPNQYIWLEFHNVGHNDKLDFLQYSNTSCLHQGTPGIYAYYQIGRDVLEGTSNQVWDTDNRDNLRIISNEGYWDYEQHQMETPADFVCTNWGQNATCYIPTYSNAFCGYQDQEKFIVPKDYDTDLGNTVDSVFENGQFSHVNNVIREYAPYNMIKGNDTIRNGISFIGDSLDAFSAYRKINMGTNPSSCNAKTCYTSNTLHEPHLTFEHNSALNNTATYLTGLSIEMIPRNNGTSWLVKIRWDDYDVTDDARWTGKIVLKGPEQVNLTRSHSITLAQNRTPAQQYRDGVSGYFAEPTKLTCEAGSVFTQQPLSSVILTEQSRLVLNSNATYHLGDSAQILVQGGSLFELQRGSHFDGGIGSTIIVDSLGTLSVSDTAKLHRATNIIIRPGGKLIVNGGTLTSACNSEMWEGIIVEGNENLPQNESSQGCLILNNATIENACNAISTHRANDSIWVGTGGIVQATNSTFRNNHRTVEFSLYENTNAVGEVIDNISFFRNCKFEENDANLFDAYGTSFSSHLTLWGVRGVQFEGCKFSNTISSLSGSARGNAILSIEAGYCCQRYCPEISQNPCSCSDLGSDSVSYCSFSGFDEAVHSSNSSGQYFIKIDNCKFANNQCGISLNAVTNAQVSFNKFVLPNQKDIYGIKLYNCSGYLVEGDTMLRISPPLNKRTMGTGIYVNNSGTKENLFYKCNFQKLNYGIYASGRNSSIPASQERGLQFLCNYFDDNGYDIAVISGSVRQIQGAWSHGADNDFFNTQVSSFQISDNTVYFHSTGSAHVPYAPSSVVTVNASAQTAPCESIICDDESKNASEAKTMIMQFIEAYEECQDDIYCKAEICKEIEGAFNEAVHSIISDSVMDFEALKDLYHTMLEKMPKQQASHSYQLAEIYNHLKDFAAASELLNIIPEYYEMDEVETEDYENYLALQQLQERIPDRNWHNISESELIDLQYIAELNMGLAAREAKEILCFFHGICYEDEKVMEHNIAERKTIKDSPKTICDDDVIVWPNPVGDLLTIESASLIREVTIYDLSGRKILSKNFDGINSVEIGTAFLGAGSYLVNISTSNGVI